jgi:NhaA family Na+:H+ antiporter
MATDTISPRPDLTVAEPIDALLRPIQIFARYKLAGAGLLLVATVSAIVWANSAWAHSYHALLDMPVTVSVGPRELTQTVHHLINDGLMSMFFFLVGLEIKRELLVGELSSARKAALPAIAALGGMLAPALIYLVVNPGGPERAGWGIPMATDIAFALGVLAVAGSRIPIGLKVLLTALAIVDDIGAVLVIAVFYTDSIATWSLVAGVVGAGFSLAMNKTGVRSSVVYFVLGLLVWLAFLQSGVHATIAALLMAFTIPARTRIDGTGLVARLEAGLSEMRRIGPPTDKGLNTPEQQHVLDRLSTVRDMGSAPLQDLEHTMAGVVTFVVLPLFALANAGVSFTGVGFESLTSGVTLGVMLGLLLGKPLGIVGFSWLAVRLRLADLPAGVNWAQVVGVGLFGAIGFTMALFIGGLAFPDPAHLDSAKLGILATSVIAAVLGLVVLRRSVPAS